MASGCGLRSFGNADLLSQKAITGLTFLVHDGNHSRRQQFALDLWGSRDLGAYRQR
jgi:hypothetical protein